MESSKERLKKKINNKRDKRNGKNKSESAPSSSGGLEGLSGLSGLGGLEGLNRLGGLNGLNGMDESSLFSMLNKVNHMLKQNPEMIKKVSKCVNNVFDNKDLMSSLVSEISKTQEDQTFVNKTDDLDNIAVENESKQ